MNSTRMRFATRMALAAMVALTATCAGPRTASAAVQSFTIDPVATLSADGTRVTVTGTFVGSSIGGLARVAGSLIQVQGRVQVFANGSFGPFAVDGSVQHWQVTAVVPAGSLTLKNGPATARVSIEIFATDPMTGETIIVGSAFAQVRVSLHR